MGLWVVRWSLRSYTARRVRALETVLRTPPLLLLLLLLLLLVPLVLS